MIRLTIISFFFYSFLLFSQENSNTTPAPLPDNSAVTNNVPSDSEITRKAHTAALIGIVPGLGQAYLGNHIAGGVQLGAFFGIGLVRSSFASGSDYIPYENRDVKFDLGQAILGNELRKNGTVYNDMPAQALLKKADYTYDQYTIFSETNFDRNARLVKDGKLAEQNPLITYGDYTRTSRSTYYSDMLGNPMLGTMFYSVYSSYRDAGGTGEFRKEEKFSDLAFAPFNTDVLRRVDVLIPIAFYALLGSLQSIPNGQENPTLGPGSLRRDGSLYVGTFVDGLSPAIGEEAFFRGYVNHSLVTSAGPVAGIGASGLLFMAAHEGNSDAIDGRLSRLLFGLYSGWVHYNSGFDLRPSIAIHFWFNVIVGLSQLNMYRDDPNYNKSQREVHYMPISYTFKF